MVNLIDNPIIYVISDSIGETAEYVVRAAVSQFNGGTAEIRRISYVDDRQSIDEIIQSAKEVDGLIAFTIVIEDLRQYIIKRSSEVGVKTVDIMGPMIDALKSIYVVPPKMKPGLVRQLDEEYFRKVEAIEFAVKYDDGKDPRGIVKADVVLIGVSRTSKTPLSMYLAHKRLKVANVPLVPEVEPSEELFKVSNKKIIGLKINPEKLNTIREERLKSLGLSTDANYANYERILEELEYAEKIMKRIGCPVIDVSNKAIEETANIILDMIKKR
ncbi:phosphoenolpyruvate synthase regulatory protein [Vulcanibacillus modesticaldus]|uniref:Putative pyruvate, phosphate dikinase regulatory protein n=1 Tax=Vulcanibacillus modesticaldus TaxID=337097 RepID=A0A1D2YVR0_9BACI|nr:phosphoenolpyruvate synthase regulatory protein [Vulcanibacillus modesticaldus]